MNIQCIALDEIKNDPNIQPRTKLVESVIFEYAQKLADGEKFPPVDVFYDGQVYWLADGFHRFEAHLIEMRETIEARIYQGGKTEALKHAAGSNATHGIPRNKDDKKRVVELILTDSDLGINSDRQIAKWCRVSQPFVGKVRKKLIDNGYQFPATRICSDNRQMNVAQIGYNRGQDSQQTQVSATAASENLQEIINASETQARTDEDAAGSHPVEETPDTVNSESGTNQVDDSGSTGESQTDIPEASASEMEGQTDDPAPAEDQMDLPQEPESVSQEIDDDIPTLKAKIAELQEALKARDLKIQKQEMVIEELEVKIYVLQKEISLYEKEIKCYEDEELAREQANKSQLMVSEAMF